jgi:hypothetical protein
MPAQPTAWGQVLGTGGGRLKATQGRSPTKPRRTARPRRHKKTRREARWEQSATGDFNHHGKEGIDGSSPSEGSEKILQMPTFSRSAVAAIGDEGRTCPRYSSELRFAASENPCKGGSCPTLSMPTCLQGKEGVDGSSPSEGSAKYPQIGHLWTRLALQVVQRELGMEPFMEPSGRKKASAGPSSGDQTSES